MGKIRILLLDPYGFSPEALAVLRESGEVDVGPLDRAELLARIEAYEVLFLRFSHLIDRQLFKAASKLRIIATNATGIDHIDEEAAREHGVRVISLRGQTEFLRTISSTAEHTWALLLALTRNLPAAAASVLAGEWERERFIGRDLDGKCLGIVGLGRIGVKVARYAAAFGMEVIAFDPAPAVVPAGVKLASSLQDVLAAADILSLHVPLNPSTTGLIGATEVAAMKKGALLLNTSRGAVLCEDALLAALTGGHLGGAALDVLADEGMPGFTGASPLVRYARSNPNLILTPHIGGATWDSWRRTELFIAGRIRDAYREPAGY